MNSLWHAIKTSAINQLFMATAFLVSADYIFCWQIFSKKYSEGMSFQNTVAFVVMLASLSNLIPDFWYESIGNLFKVIAQFLVNKDDDGLLDKFLQSRPAVLGSTCVLIVLLLALSTSIIFGPNNLFAAVKELCN